MQLVCCICKQVCCLKLFGGIPHGIGPCRAVCHYHALTISTEPSSSSLNSPQTCIHLLVWLYSSESHVSASEKKEFKETGPIANLYTIINCYGNLYLFVCSGIKPRGGLCPVQGGKRFSSFSAFHGIQMSLGLAISFCWV